MRIYIEIKRDADPHRVLNNLFKHTAMQIAFNMNMLALVDGQPQTLPLKAVLQHYIDYRREVVRRRTSSTWRRPRPGSHPGRSQDRARQPRRRDQDDPGIGRRGHRPDEPHDPLQADRDPGSGDPRHAPGPPGRPRAQEDRDEYLEVIQLIAELEDILANPSRVLGVIRDELNLLKQKYAGTRRTRSRTTPHAR